MSIASTREGPELRPSRASRVGGPGEKLVQEEKDEGEEDSLGVQQATVTWMRTVPMYDQQGGEGPNVGGGGRGCRSVHGAYTLMKTGLQLTETDSQ